jgi:hypothetical protein
MGNYNGLNIPMFGQPIIVEMKVVNWFKNLVHLGINAHLGIKSEAGKAIVELTSKVDVDHHANVAVKNVLMSVRLLKLLKKVLLLKKH